MHVLWLCSWYPNRIDASTGDFIERHAFATAPFVSKLSIIAVFKDESMKPGAWEIVRSQQGNLNVYIGYYGPSSFQLAEKINSYFTYMHLQQKMMDELVGKFGKPDLLHVHVAMKAGLFAMRIAKKYSIPYLLTEHWTGYLPDAIPNLKSKGSWYSRLTKKVLKSSAVLLPVSNHLGEQILKMASGLTTIRVFNAVDTRLFFYSPRQNSTFRFVHFSYLNQQKNPEGIIAACEMLHKEGFKFECMLVGNESDKLSKMAEEKGLLNSSVFIMPAVSYATVGSMMRAADALVLFSRFENMPCVVLEALCAGLPVVSTNVGGIHEVVDASNGILLPEGDVEALANAMKKIMQQRNNYNSHNISESARAKFGYDTIGKEISDIYKKISVSSD